MSSSSAPSAGFIAFLQEHSHFTPYYDSGYWISDALGLLRQRLPMSIKPGGQNGFAPHSEVLSSVHLRFALSSNNSFL